MLTTQPLFSFQRMILLCLVLVGSIPFATTVAGEVTSLYSADIPVQGQGERERIEAAKQALSVVLTKVTGRQSTPTLAELAATLRQPMHFVQQFHYITLTEDQQLLTDGGGNPYQQLVRFEFDSKAINQELRQAGVPIWGRARPATLVWLAVEEQGQRLIVGGEQLSNLRQVIEQQAEHRGLPVLFPLLDLQDQTAVRFTDLWGDFQDDIMRGSTRYQAEGVLVGRLYRSSSQEWQARWSLYLNDSAQRWTSAGVSFQQALVGGINQLAETYADQFAVQVSVDGKQRITLNIGEVATLAAYAKVMQYLQSQDMVKDLLVDQIATDHVLYSFTLHGELGGLKQAFAFGDTLVPVAIEELDPGIFKQPGTPDLSLPPSLQTEIETTEKMASKPLSAMLYYRLLP